MLKLLSANFSRLWKDKVFWICMGTMLVYSALFMWDVGHPSSEWQRDIFMDKYYFQFAPVIGIFCALFSSLYFGTEYSDGTIRNKLVAGHTRTNIYLSNFIVMFTASLLMMLSWMAGTLAGIPVLGKWEMDERQIFLYFLIVILMLAAFSSIYTFAGMLSSNKAITVVISVLLFLGMMMLSFMLYNTLCEQPEILGEYQITADGMTMDEPTPNPYYISGMQRKIYEFMVDFLPTGQGIKLWILEISNSVRNLASSFFITVAAVSGGIFLFKRKDLK